MPMMYQIGNVHHLRDDDPLFDTYQEALMEATEHTTGNEAVWGIWTDEESGSELLALVFQGNVFE